MLALWHCAQAPLLGSDGRLNRLGLQAGTLLFYRSAPSLTLLSNSVAGSTLLSAPLRLCAAICLLPLCSIPLRSASPCMLFLLPLLACSDLPRSDPLLSLSSSFRSCAHACYKAADFAGT